MPGRSSRVRSCASRLRRGLESRLPLLLRNGLGSVWHAPLAVLFVPPPIVTTKREAGTTLHFEGFIKQETSTDIQFQRLIFHREVVSASLRPEIAPQTGRNHISARDSLFKPDFGTGFLFAGRSDMLRDSREMLFVAARIRHHRCSLASPAMLGFFRALFAISAFLAPLLPSRYRCRMTSPGARRLGALRLLRGRVHFVRGVNSATLVLS